VALACGLSGGLLWSALRWNLVTLVSPAAIQEILAGTGALAPLVLMALMAAAVVVSPIPSLPLDIAAGAAFGPTLGTLYAAAGALVGSIISFGIARLLGRELVERVVGGHISFCRDCSDRLLTRVVFASRLIPGVSFDVVSYGAGLTKISLGRFCLATFFGMLPLTFAYVSFGPLLVSGGLLSLVAGGAVVVLFLLLPRLVEKNNLFWLRAKFKH
jgi:uncharacterized membrane protein YdjX (TVP38/TMEM64 family)